jgi:pyruvate, water dikinase
MSLTPLIDAGEPARFGGKAAALAVALRGGLPVPDGFALSTDGAGGEPTAAALRTALGDRADTDRWAVRSSGIGEDADGASFAGQHLSVLGVSGVPALLEAIARVRASVLSASAAAYRARSGISGPARTGVVLQRLVDAETAGVLFTQNPMTGARELVIEASWGLGEAVVAGLVTPDRYRLSLDGALLERTLGDKELRIAILDGVSQESETPESERARFCLDWEGLGQLHALTGRVDRLWPGPHDVEFAFGEGRLFLLQRRPLTVRPQD